MNDLDYFIKQEEKRIRRQTEVREQAAEAIAQFTRSGFDRIDDYVKSVHEKEEQS